MNLYLPLKKYFGFSQFKGLQEEVIKSILQKKNTFVIMPTGGGKSLCYQLPALMNTGTAIVISPLIALMKNQVDAIRGISDHEGVAHVLNSSLNKSEVSKVKSDIENGITKLLYVAPESLIKEEYVNFLKKHKPVLYMEAKKNEESTKKFLKWFFDNGWVCYWHYAFWYRENNYRNNNNLILNPGVGDMNIVAVPENNKQPNNLLKLKSFDEEWNEKDLTEFYGSNKWL